MVSNGSVVHLLPPSYHGSQTQDQSDMLVFHEPGDDFESMCREVGFEVSVQMDVDNEAVCTFICRRPTVAV